jgi:hypothetical protein
MEGDIIDISPFFVDYCNMEINDTVKLIDGRSGKILATPSGFMSNGAYEIEIEGGERVWVEEDMVLYKIDLEWLDNIENYFEIMFDKDGVHLIPKRVQEITVDDEQDELKSITFIMDGNEKHKTITMHIGDTDVWSGCNPKPEPPKEPKKYDLL